MSLRNTYRLLIYCCCLCAVIQVSAQQRPYYSQYILNNYIINPALAGIENYTDIKLSHRRQWTGITDAPVTTYLTMHAPLKKDDYGRETVNTFYPYGENPLGRANWRDYNNNDPHHGVGLTFLNDVTGPLSRIALQGTYAYHMSVAPGLMLSGGVSVGFTQLRLDATKLNFGDVNLDPAVSSSGVLNRMRPDISAGFWLYSSRFFAGLSVQQLVPQQVAFSDNNVYLDNSRLIPHTFLSLGYRFSLSDEVSMLPSLQVRYISPLPVGLDLNLKFRYLDQLWVGGSYRHKEGGAAMAGIKLNTSWHLGYAYEMATNNTLNTFARGSHELTIGFLLGNKVVDWTPRNVW